MLAMAIFIKKYKKNALNNVKDKIKTVGLRGGRAILGIPLGTLDT
jgi:hypothetical protein